MKKNIILYIIVFAFYCHNNNRNGDSFKFLIVALYQEIVPGEVRAYYSAGSGFLNNGLVPVFPISIKEMNTWQKELLSAEIPAYKLGYTYKVLFRGSSAYDNFVSSSYADGYGHGHSYELIEVKETIPTTVNFSVKVLLQIKDSDNGFTNVFELNFANGNYEKIAYNPASYLGLVPFDCTTNGLCDAMKTFLTNHGNVQAQVTVDVTNQKYILESLSFFGE